MRQPWNRMAGGVFGSARLSKTSIPFSRLRLRSKIYIKGIVVSACDHMNRHHRPPSGSSSASHRTGEHVQHPQKGLSSGKNNYLGHLIRDERREVIECVQIRSIVGVCTLGDSPCYSVSRVQTTMLPFPIVSFNVVRNCGLEVGSAKTCFRPAPLPRSDSACEFNWTLSQFWPSFLLQRKRFLPKRIKVIKGLHHILIRDHPPELDDGSPSTLPGRKCLRRCPRQNYIYGACHLRFDAFSSPTSHLRNLQR